MTEASDDLDAEMSSLGSDGDEQDADDEGDLPETIQGDDKLYYCTKCTAEIEDGFCFLCGEERQWLPDESTQSTVSIISQASHPNRSLIPCGDTFLREIDIDHSEGPPGEYHSPYQTLYREEECWELIRHGATQLMCKAFYLQFSYAEDIYAWADDEIFSECSGSLLRPGDVWKAHLGRPISFDADDLDGSAFIEGLLEDALLYPRPGINGEL
ncbi:hypothetical protein CPB84DRAFT_178281 [Gymnopilus junonius]|uniref:Uncharacterized protein n=1 Tax=Gymnopilus junonius TaxID=109634 RepID=A0A9P5TI57_GYMJU|nr:hypothetical protein CPB84DRAFT_178281 [Gymnopilus junonius]